MTAGEGEMQQNPYQAPNTAGVRPSDVVTPELRDAAKYQRWLNLIILSYIALIVVVAVVTAVVGESDVINLVLGLAYFALGLTSLVVVFSLAKALHDITGAVVCIALMFMPCVNLLTMVVLSSTATSRLKKAGIKVGLLGANSDQFD